MTAWRVVPSASLTETSPSSASASSAVMTKPVFQMKPDARERCEWTETMAGAALATTSAIAADSEERGESVMASSIGFVCNLGVRCRFGNCPDGEDISRLIRHGRASPHVFFAATKKVVDARHQAG